MHPFVVLALAVAAGAATMIGGLFAISMRDRLHLVLGFSAGAVIGVAFFDLLPESIETARLAPRDMLGIAALGFFLYVLLDRLVVLHSHNHEEQHRERRGWIGAGSLSVHSFMDGLALGVAFQASQTVGLVVASAILVHDFSDGLNTVNVVVKNGAGGRAALGWLAVDAFAPILGAAASLLIVMPANVIGILLAIFAGFFLYIGASDLLPESHHVHPRLLTTLSTLAGALCLFVVTRSVR